MKNRNDLCKLGQCQCHFNQNTEIFFTRKCTYKWWSFCSGPNLSSNVIYFSSSPSGPRHGCGHGVQSFIQCYLFFFFPFRSSAWLRPWRYFAASGVKSITTSIGPLQTLTSTSHPSLSTHGKTPSSEEPVHHVPESNEGLYEDIFSYLETFIWF